MNPSVEQMLEAAQLALREHVAPTVTDQWAASALRSVDVILSHLQARAPVEGPMLFEDNADLAGVLAEALGLALEAQLAAGLRGFVAEVAAVSGYPAVAELCALNIRGRGLVDEVLLACHALDGDTQAARVHEVLRGYLRRHVERERPFFFPVFIGRPF